MKSLLALLLLCASLAWGSEAFLGVVLEDEPTAISQADGGLAVRVESVVADSPADKAGIKGGDLLVRFDGKSVTDRDDLSFYLGKHDPGDTVELVIQRSGEKRTLSAKLARKAESRKTTVTVMGRELGGNTGFLGVTTQEINRNLLEFFGVKEGYGVLVDGIIANSAAARNGILVGDVIVEIDGKQVDSVDRLGRIARSYEPGTQIKVLVYREGKARTLSLPIGKRSHSSLAPRAPVPPVSPALPLGIPLHAAGAGAEFGLDMSEAVLDGVEQSIAPMILEEEELREFRQEMAEARRELAEERRELRRDLQELRRDLREDRESVR